MEIASCGKVSALTLGLPSTTAVPANRSHITKEAFYQHTKVSSRLHRHFIEDINGITILAVIRNQQQNLQATTKTQEIEVIGLSISSEKLPTEVMEHIARTRDDLSKHTSRMLFACIENNQCTLAVFRNANAAEHLMESAIYSANSVPAQSARLKLIGNNLDEEWDSLCSQIILHNEQTQHVDQRIVLRKRIIELNKEQKRLGKALMRTEQIAERNVLWPQLQQVKAELKHLQKEEQ